MDTDLFNFLTTQGTFALLFGYLLLYVLKQNQIREENYQKNKNPPAQLVVLHFRA